MYFKIELKLMKIIFIFFAIVFLTIPAAFYAQTSKPDKDQKTDKSLISVPVSVSDREGRYITGLKEKDFTLYQDGVKQNITFFATYDEPLNIALLLDTSGSTQDSLEKIKDAAKDFIELLNPNDQCLLATFDSQVKILNPLTSNRQTLKSSLGKIQTAMRDGTLLHSAVDQIARNSFNDAQGRKVILILSDGKDLGSSITKTQMLSQLEESDVLIYSIFYKTGESFDKLVISSDGTVKEGKEGKKNIKSAKKPRKKSKGYSVFIPAQTDQPNEVEIELREKKADLEAVNSLKEIADTTAGRFYLSDTPKLREVFKKVAGELRQQYRLGYRSKDAANNAATHDIVVKVERPDMTVRARGKFRAKQL